MHGVVEGELLSEGDDVENLEARHGDHVVLELGPSPWFRLEGQTLDAELVTLEDNALHTADDTRSGRENRKWIHGHSIID